MRIPAASRPVSGRSDRLTHFGLQVAVASEAVAESSSAPALEPRRGSSPLAAAVLIATSVAVFYTGNAPGAPSGPLSLPRGNKQEALVPHSAATDHTPVNKAAGEEAVDPDSPIPQEVTSGRVKLVDPPPGQEISDAIRSPQPTSRETDDASQLAVPGMANRVEPGRSEELLDAQWIEAQPPGNLTLQLLASDEPERLSRFAAQHALGQPLADYSSSRRGRRLHLLLQGSYADRDAAEAALASLPPEVRQLSPWIREFRAVRSELESGPAPAASPKRKQVPEPPFGVAWVWTQSPHTFTLQLAAARKRETLSVQLGRAPLPGPTAIVPGVRDGDLWYALVNGVYPSRKAAEEAAAQLAPAWRQAGPFVRSFAAIQDGLSARR